MKKYFLIGLIVAIAPNLCLGASARYTQLVREKQRKIEELEKCMGATKGLKIAGISTLGLTAVGVAGNIAEAQKRDSYEADMKSLDKKITKLDGEITEETEALDNKKKTLPEKKDDKTQEDNTELREASYVINCQTSGGRPIGKNICICTFGEPDDTGKCVSKKETQNDDTIEPSDVTTQIAVDAVFGDENELERKRTKEFILGNKSKTGVITTNDVIKASQKAATDVDETDDDGENDE